MAIQHSARESMKNSARRWRYTKRADPLIPNPRDTYPYQARLVSMRLGTTFDGHGYKGDRGANNQQNTDAN